MSHISELIFNVALHFLFCIMGTSGRIILEGQMDLRYQRLQNTNTSRHVLFVSKLIMSEVKD